MLEASIAFSPEGFAQYTRLGMVPNPLSRVAVSQSYAFRSKDGRLVSVHLSSVEKFWQGFVQAIGRADLLDDARFQTPPARAKHYEELAGEVAETFASRDQAYWCERLQANDVPHAPVNSAPQVMEDAQVRHLETFYEVRHPEQGAMTAIHRPVRINGQRGPSDKAAPTLGEHTETIRREFGLS